MYANLLIHACYCLVGQKLGPIVSLLLQLGTTELELFSEDYGPSEEGAFISQDLTFSFIPLLSPYFFLFSDFWVHTTFPSSSVAQIYLFLFLPF